MKDDTRQSLTAIGSSSMVRLILERPSDGHVLLARYEATERERYGSAGLMGYWSFLGLPFLGLIGNESSVLEAVVRTADRHLGIMIHDVDYVTFLYDRNKQPPALGRVYVWIRSWSGSLPVQIDEPGHEENRGLYDWVSQNALGCYISHPEVVTAAQAWLKLKKQKAIA